MNNIKTKSNSVRTRNNVHINKTKKVSSNVLELNVGSLVLKINKLNKDSSINVSSSIGTAGVRG